MGQGVVVSLSASNDQENLACPS